MMMSECAWAVLKQLKRGAVWDGDLISKQGRTTLIERGLARRDRKFEGGPYDGMQKNELTDAGLSLAVVCVDLDQRFGAVN